MVNDADRSDLLGAYIQDPRKLGCSRLWAEPAIFGGYLPKHGAILTECLDVQMTRDGTAAEVALLEYPLTGLMKIRSELVK